MSTGRPCLYHHRHLNHDDDDDALSPLPPPPRLVVVRDVARPTPPSSTLLDATSCSACLAACRAPCMLERTYLFAQQIHSYPLRNTQRRGSRCACAFQTREKARPVLVKINQPYPKVIFHYSKKTIVAHRIRSKRLGSNSDKEVLVLLVLMHTPLAATVFFFLLKKKILHQHFFFGKYLDQRGVPSVSVWQPASPSRSQALPARALHVRNFHPFFYLFGSSRQGGITQPQKPKLHG